MAYVLLDFRANGVLVSSVVSASACRHASIDIQLLSCCPYGPKLRAWCPCLPNVSTMFITINFILTLSSQSTFDSVTLSMHCFVHVLVHVLLQQSCRLLCSACCRRQVCRHLHGIMEPLSSATIICSHCKALGKKGTLRHPGHELCLEEHALLLCHCCCC